MEARGGEHKENASTRDNESRYVCMTCTHTFTVTW